MNFIIVINTLALIPNLLKKMPLIKRRNASENSPGSVRAASCSTAAMICVSGNDLCHSASNWDLTLQLTHMLFITVSVIPLYSQCVCVSINTILLERKSVNTSRRVKLKVFYKPA